MEPVEKYFDKYKEAIASLPKQDIKKMVNILYEAYKKNKQIFIFGNGGSASIASHFACDLGKGTLQRVYDENEKRFRVMSLTDNVAILTAFGNDLDFENIFSQQLKNLVTPGDIVIAISASGNSPNILNAIKTASKANAITIGILGFDGGEAKKIVNHNIHVKSDNYGIVEDIHMSLMHSICFSLSEMKKMEKAE